MENSILLKGLTLRAPKWLVFQGYFSHNLHGQPWDFNVWTELSEFSCKFGRHFNRSRYNCSCAQIMNIRETEPWETDWIVISSEEATGQASLFTFSHALKTFTRYEIVTWFRL